MTITIDVVFTNGLGDVTATVFRDGNEVASGNRNTTGAIALSNVQSMDMISLDGVSQGATVTISVPTSPETPDTYPEGPIQGGYSIV